MEQDGDRKSMFSSNRKSLRSAGHRKAKSAGGNKPSTASGSELPKVIEKPLSAREQDSPRYDQRLQVPRQPYHTTSKPNFRLSLPITSEQVSGRSAHNINLDVKSDIVGRKTSRSKRLSMEDTRNGGEQASTAIMKRSREERGALPLLSDTTQQALRRTSCPTYCNKGKEHGKGNSKKQSKGHESQVQVRSRSGVTHMDVDNVLYGKNEGRKEEDSNVKDKNLEKLRDELCKEFGSMSIVARKCTTRKSLHRAMDYHCKRVQKMIDSGSSSKAINQSRSRKLPLRTELSSPGLVKGTYDEASDLEPTRHKTTAHASELTVDSLSHYQLFDLGNNPNLDTDHRRATITTQSLSNIKEKGATKRVKRASSGNQCRRSMDVESNSQCTSKAPSRVAPPPERSNSRMSEDATYSKRKSSDKPQNKSLRSSNSPDASETVECEEKERKSSSKNIGKTHSKRKHRLHRSLRTSSSPVASETEKCEDKERKSSSRSIRKLDRKEGIKRKSTSAHEKRSRREFLMDHASSECDIKSPDTRSHLQQPSQDPEEGSSDGTLRPHPPRSSRSQRNRAKQPGEDGSHMAHSSSVTSESSTRRPPSRGKGRKLSKGEVATLLRCRRTALSMTYKTTDSRRSARMNSRITPTPPAAAWTSQATPQTSQAVPLPPHLDPASIDCVLEMMYLQTGRKNVLSNQRTDDAHGNGTADAHGSVTEANLGRTVAANDEDEDDNTNDDE